MKLKQIYLFSILLAGLLVFVGGLQAQEATPAKPSVSETAPIRNKTLMHQIKEGGWVMIPIAACSILMVYLIIDGVLRTSPKKALPAEHVESVKSLFRQGDYVGAYNCCKSNPSPFTNVCRVAVSQLGEGKTAVEEGIYSEISKENSRMQTYISYLSVIGVCAPMIGLLGTVTGMMSAFSTLGTSGIGDPSSLSAAIGEVLTATASGLFIAIPAFGFYYYLRSRAAKILHDIQDTMASLLRKMPYDQIAGAHIGDEELYAATPNWISASQAAAQA